VKKLRIYSKLESVYVDDGRGISKAKILYDGDSYFLEYINEKKPRKRIYSRGKKRISLEYGVFIIGQDRKWNKILDLL
jgi:hypothetical protein